MFSWAQNTTVSFFVKLSVQFYSVTETSSEIPLHFSDD